MITTYLLGGLFILVVAFLLRSSARSPYYIDPELYDRALAQAGDSLVSKIMISVSRRVSGLPSIHSLNSTPLYRAIERKLLAASGIYGGSVDIFLSVQIAAALFAAADLVALFVFNPSIPLFIVGLLVAVGVMMLPYDQVRKRVALRTDIVSSTLPDFAELLLMPLSLGMGVIPALRFTTDRLTGPVAEEMDAMLLLIESQSLEDERLPFVLAGAHLGTPEAMSFCNALMMAHLESMGVVANIAAQAKSLRVSQFQKTRALAKKLPIKLVVLFATHLLPMLFIAIMIPVVIGFIQAFRG